MIGLTALAVTLVACLGTGALPCPFVPRKQGEKDVLLFSTALGLGLISLATLGAGLGQVWNSRLFGACVAAALLPGVWRLACLLRDLHLPKLSPAEWTAVALLLALFALTLLGACAPVTDWDGLSYHLAVPELFLRHGGVYWISFIHHSNFPFATEMLFAPAVALGQPEAAKVVHWVFYLLTSGAAGALAAELFGKRTAVWAALAAGLMPVAIWEAQSAYIDLSTSAYILLSATALTRSFRDDRDELRWVVIAALLAGMAAGTKTFALGWILLAALWVGYERRGGRSAVQHWTLFLIISTLISCPWYIKSLLMTGNPVYPFLYSVFGGKAWGPAGVEMYRQVWTSFGAGRSIGDFIMLPWNLLARGGDFIDGAILFGSPGPLVAALLPGALPRMRGHARQLALVALIYTAAWFVLSQQTRYLLPLLAMGATLVCAATAGADRVSRCSRACVLLAGAVSVLLAFALVSPSFDLIRGAITRDAYISRYVNSYWASRYLPRETRLLLYREPRGFYFPQEYLWADEALSSVIPYERFASPARMIEWLRAHGWQAALINRRFTDEERPGRDITLWNGAISQGLVRPLGGVDHTNPMTRGVELWAIP